METTTKQMGDQYEDFTREVYESIKEIETLGLVKCTTIEQHKLIQNAYGVKREIDLYWEYTDLVTNELKKVAIECKNYKNPVSIEKIDAFNTKISDLNIDHAIFCAKHGVQSGGIECAKHHNIQIIELREPEDSDMEGRIQQIVCTIHFCLPPKILNIDIKLGFDEDSKPESGKYYITSLDPVYSSAGEVIGSFSQFVYDEAKEKSPGTYDLLQRMPDNYLLINDKKAFLLEVSINYRVVEPEVRTIDIHHSEVIRAIMKIVGVGDFCVTFGGETRAFPPIEK